MGVEALSLLMYDDEPLLREMIDHIVDHCIRLFGPVAKKADFDFVYIFEDCCGSYGPLFSPEKYDILFDGPYRRLIDFYKRECRIPFILIDSDGVPDALVPCWLKSGFDIIFPVEVGKWKGSPNKLRNRFGCDFGMLGGVDKHLIRQGGQALRDHLTELLPAVRGGRYLPIPDHRIPPEVSLQDMQKYIALFNEVFNG
jgi:uroporphyrinogen decarboxylase